MSKVLNASCEAGSVSCEGQKLEGVVILGEGVEASEGVLIIQNGVTYYVPKTSPDLKEVITLLNDILGSIATIATGIDAATNSPNAQAAAIAQLQTKIAQFNQKGEALR